MTQVTMMTMLKKSHELLWDKKTNAAEIRDTARNNAVVFSGTRRECVTEAKRLGLWHGK